MIGLEPMSLVLKTNIIKPLYYIKKNQGDRTRTYNYCSQNNYYTYFTTPNNKKCSIGLEPITIDLEGQCSTNWANHIFF